MNEYRAVGDEDHLHDECGEVGITGIPDAAEAVYLALYALQHRGQESAGIVATAGDGFRQHKGMGVVADVFTPEALDRLKGSLAIGHNRYSTTGDSSVRNIQPLRVNYHGGELALAHNGQLVDAVSTRRAMERRGSIFQTSSDSEVLVHLIATSRGESTEARLLDALGRVHGAFSIVVMAGETLYAARDSHGFRPLVLGRRGSGWVVVSETYALDIVEAEFVREIEPGEVIAITPDGVTTVGRLPRTELHRCVFELIYFSRPDSCVFGESVDRVRRRLGRRLAEEHPVKADCVISVPDSSNSAALGFAEASQLPFELGLIRNHYIGRTFIRPGQLSREAGVRVKYNLVRTVLEGKSIVVVDDSIVRGTTSRKLVQLLRRGGVRKIHFRVASPPVIGPCYYGIDTPSRSELIAAANPQERIRDYLGVDTLGYLSKEGLRTCVESPSDYCYSCFTGHYPLVPDRELRAGKQDLDRPSAAGPSPAPVSGAGGTKGESTP